MNCPNCGRELMEGEVCNCTNNAAPVVNTPPQPQNEGFEQAQPQPQPQQPNYYQPEQPQQPNYYQPEQTQQPYYQPDPSQNPGFAPQDPNAFQQPMAPVMPAPVVAMPARTDYPEGYKIKKKYVAVILALWLGPFGIHHFYLGDKTKGIVKILLSTVGALVAVGPLVATIWSIVDAVMLLTENTDRDAEGFKIQTFEEALVAQRMKAEAALAEEEKEEEEAEEAE